jgi:hypothetical protein
MNKFYGNIGYAETVETSPGYWEPSIIVKPSYGEWIRYSSKFQITADSTNDNKDVANELSIVANPYAEQHFSDMRFVEYGGKKWKITAVKPQFPRLILTVGGIYNGGREQA